VAATPTPDPAANPVLLAIQKLGAKIYYLGTRSSMDGWFIVKDGQVQIAYASPDNKSLVIGALFGENSENVTSLQVATLIQNNKEIADLITNAQKEQAALIPSGNPSATPAATGASSLPSTPLSPGERLMHDLGGASTVVIGNASTPEILMVMDPFCPFCGATWKALRDTVTKGNVHLRLIPIGTINSDNERAAAVLLGVSDPLAAWDKAVSGDKTSLDGTPPETALKAVRANHAMIDSWNIKDTPYLVYRAKDGKVKIVQGKPDNTSAVLTDLGL
jgi:hypothetical protein